MSFHESKYDHPIPLNEQVLEAVQAVMTPEYVADRIQQHVTKLLDDAIQKALSSWSPTGKEIDRAVQESLRVVDLDLPSYGHVVSQILEAQIQLRVSEVVSAKLSQDTENLLKLAPKQVKLSELIADLLAKEDDSCSCDPAEVSLEIEHTEYSSCWVYIHPGSKPKSQYDYDVRLLVSLPKRAEGYKGDEPLVGVISQGHVRGTDLKKDVRFGYGAEHYGQKREFGRWFGFEQKILAMYAVGTQITLDEHDCILSNYED